MGWQARSCRSLNIGEDRRAGATLMDEAFPGFSVDPRSHTGGDAQRIGGGTRVEFAQVAVGILQVPHVKVISRRDQAQNIQPVGDGVLALLCR